MHRDNRRAREKVLTIVCTLLVTDLLGIIVSASPEDEPCTHSDCVEHAVQLTESIDESINPCDDFVEFACGNQFKKFERLGQQDVDSRSTNRYFIKPTTYSLHLWWIRQKLKTELDQPYRVEEPRSIGLAKMYWRSCKITSAEEALIGVQLLFKRLGGWPVITENWQEKYFTWEKFSKCARLLGFLPRMFVHVAVNADDVDKPWYPNDTIELSLERSKFMYNREDMAKTMARANEFLRVAEHLTENQKPDIAEIEEALEFGKQIHLLTHSQEMPIVEQKIMSIAKLQKTYPFVNWMDYIRAMLTRRQANYLSDRNCVIVDVCYLSQIGNLLEKTSKRVQANYAFLSIIDDLFLFIRPQLALTFATDQQEIEQICFDSVSAIFGKALAMILAKMAGQNMKLRVNQVQKNIAQQGQQMFKKIPWMDHKTQLQAAEKSEKTTFINLFEDDIFEERYFDRLEFTQPDATLVLFREVNVFLVDHYYLQVGRPRNMYILHRRDNRTMFAIFKSTFSATEAIVKPDRISNQVYIPASAALQDRFSNKHEMDFLNYATIGIQIANAMGHQIYQRGAFIDRNGYWRENSWWSKTTQKQFASRPTCIDVGSVTPLEEMSPIFGYIGAAEIAYKAMFENPATFTNTTLSGLNYNTKQLFWITAVASDCDKDLKHRYNMMVAHNSDFAADFNCPVGSNMNIAEKCKMWIE